MALYLTIAGLVFTTIGAVLIGSNDLMSKKKAVEIGVIRASGATVEVNLELPVVKELLRRSRKSSLGLAFVLMGSVFLIIASLG